MTEGVNDWRLCPHDSIDRNTLICARCGSKVEPFIPPDSFTVTPPFVGLAVLPTPDPFDLLQRYASEFGTRQVAHMIRYAAPASPLHGASFKYSTAGEWSFKPRLGVTAYAAAWELCRLLGVVK